jgi:hypothetical protein
MHLPPDDIDLWISDLKDIRLNSLKHTDFQIRSTVPHLERAIEILVNYSANREQQQFIPEPRPQKCQIQHKAVQKGENILESSPSPQQFQCPPGKYWVRRRLKNGDPGFCRRYRQR